MAYTTTQVHPRWIVAGVKKVCVNIFYIAGWVNQAIGQIVGMDMAPLKLLTKRQKVHLLLGLPLALRASCAT